MLRPISAALVIVCLCLPAAASGQEVADAERVEGGVKGGVTFSDIPTFADVLAEEANVDSNYRVGAAVGGFLAFSFGSNFALQPEVLYAQRGLEGRIPTPDETFKLKLSYIDLPVLLRVGPSSGRGFHLLAGPSFNINVGAQLIVGGTFNDEEDYKDEVEDLDIGFVVGGGYYGGLLIAEGRYEEGLKNVSTLSDDSYRHRGFLAMVGIRFGRSAAKPAP
jgi:hypothetical protein